MYQQLEEQLAALISAGVVAVGATLPAERRLAEDLGVSRTTVQRCYDALRRRRMLSAHGRLGYRVEAVESRLKPGMERLKGFTEEMRELGRTPSSEVLEQDVATDRSIASIFGLPSAAPLLKLVRVRLGDGMPLSVEKAWYDVSAAPALAEADLSGSVYARLAENGLTLTRCEQTIEAAAPDERESAIFGFEEPLPCLLIRRRSYDGGGRMIEYVEGLFRGDAYAYRLTLNA
ncbi:GntR family transcriptional regulator [Methylopila turkensis]|nr:GntR family transcriptional regulator [Methylopila turkensis]